MGRPRPCTDERLIGMRSRGTPPHNEGEEHRVAATTRLSVNITNETAEALRSLAKEKGTTVTDIVRQATGLLKGVSLSVVAIPTDSRPVAHPGPQARVRASWKLYSSAEFTRSAPTMPGHQWAVSTLIREVLADPNLARRASSAVCPRVGLQDLVDAEAATVIGVERYERTNRRNGTRPKTVVTTAGDVVLAIPKLRTGSFFPTLLHPRRRMDKVLHTVICSAWIEGVSTRKAWRLGAGPGQRVRDLQVHGLADLPGHRRGSQGGVPVLLPGPHLVPLPVRGRHLPGRAREPEGGLPGAGGGHRHRSVSPGQTRDPGYTPGGQRRDRRFLDVIVLRFLREKGLRVLSPDDPEDVVLVNSDTYASIRAAVREILPGASWQRYRAPLRPQHHLQAGIGPIQAHGHTGLNHLRPDQQGGRRHPVQARHRLPERPVTLQNRRHARRHPAGLDGLRRLPPRALAEDPAAATPSSGSTARSSAAQTSPRVFPDSESARPLIGSILLEQHEEWQYGERRYPSQTSLQRLTDTLHTDNSNGGRTVLSAASTT